MPLDPNATAAFDGNVPTGTDVSFLHSDGSGHPVTASVQPWTIPTARWEDVNGIPLGSGEVVVQQPVAPTMNSYEKVSSDWEERKGGKVAMNSYEKVSSDWEERKGGRSETEGFAAVAAAGPDAVLDAIEARGAVTSDAGISAIG